MVTLFLALLDHLTEPLHDSRILVGEERRTAFVQRSYLSHLLLRQFKIKEVEIVRHVCLVAAHGEDSDTPLDMPPEHNLVRKSGLAFVICASSLRRMIKQSPACNGNPRR